MTYLDDRKKSSTAPFLELSNLTLKILQQRELNNEEPIDFDNVLTLWTTLIKSGDVIKNGKRLENISWRVVNRKLILKNDFTNNDFSTLVNVSTSQNPEEFARSKVNKNEIFKPSERIHKSSTTLLAKKQSQLQPESSHLHSYTQLNSKITKRNPNQAYQNVQHEQKHRHKTMFFLNNSFSSPESSASPSDNQRDNNKLASIKQIKQDNTASLFGKPNNNIHSLFNNDTLQDDHKLNTHTIQHQRGHQHNHQHKDQPEHESQQLHQPQPQSQHQHQHQHQTRSLFGELHNINNNNQHIIQQQLRSPPSKSSKSSKITQSTKVQFDSGKADLEHLYKQQLKYNGGSAAAKSPESDTQHSQVSLFQSNNKTTEKENNLMFSSDDDDYLLDDSDWSSLSDDSNSGKDDDGLNFEKKEIYQNQLESPSITNEEPKMKRSLLSGLFLDKMVKDDQNIKSNVGTPNSKSLVSPKLVPHENIEGTKTKVSTINKSLNKFKLDERPIELFRRQSSSVSAVTKTPPLPPLHTENNNNNNNNNNLNHVEDHNNLSTLVNKSSISLTTFFANNRRPINNNSSTNEVKLGHYDRHHQSNAPPTAATLLPTALSTHMFLPTMSLQQQARAQGRDNHDSVHPNHQNLPKIMKRDTHNDNGVKLTNANLAQHGIEMEGKDEKEQEEIYSSSIKTSTSSIDIPGSVCGSGSKMKLGLPCPGSEVGKHQEIDLSKDKHETESEILTPKSTRYEMISKELSSNLMDSINNENRLFGLPVRDSYDHDNDEDNNIIAEDNDDVFENSTKHDNKNNFKTTSNIIADGIMGQGNKLHTFSKNLGNDKFSTKDVFADDIISDCKLIKSVVDDDMNYHAKGW